MTGTDSLPITQQLVLDVLAARYRLGEQVWTFPATSSPALRTLEARGLIHVMNGIAPRSRRARLTERGKVLALDNRYRPPNGGVERHRQALQAILDYAEPRRDILVGLDGIISIARKALESGPA